MNEYAALSKTPHALADGPMLVFKQPVRGAIGLKFLTLNAFADIL
jgi:hypothetical protein